MSARAQREFGSGVSSAGARVGHASTEEPRGATLRAAGPSDLHRRRVGYSVREAASLLGRRTDALRREIERHAKFEDDQIVARLAGGIAAYRRKDGGRWLISIPAHLGA